MSVGDTVRFAVGAAHPTLEVDQNTWQMNGTSDNGGFDIPSGDGDVVITSAGTYYYVCVNHVSSGMKGRIFASSGLDLQEKAFSELSLYPNPVNRELHIELNGSEQLPYRILNIQGSTLEKGNVQANEALEVEGLAPGIYFLQLGSGNTQKQLRFIKQ